MNRSIRETIKSISKKNLLLPGIIAAAMILILLLAPFKQVFQPPTAFSIEEIVRIYNEGAKYIHVSLADLNYSNFDYYTNNQNRQASYYYKLDEENGPSCIFFLIPTENTNGKSEVLETYEAKARFLTEDVRFDTFLNGFAQDIGWDSKALKEISFGFVVSQFDYRPGLTMILAGLIAVVILLCVSYMIINILFIFLPHLHPSCRRLKRFGLDGEDFSEIDRELRDSLLISAGNIHVTENYIVDIGKHNIWMIPLFNVVWAYSYGTWNPLVKKNKLKYSIVIVTSPKAKITIAGNEKHDVEWVLSFLENNYTHITVGYSDELREKMEKLL